MLCGEFTRTKLAGKRPLIVETQRSHTAIICTWIPKGKKKGRKEYKLTEEKLNPYIRMSYDNKLYLIVVVHMSPIDQSLKSL